MNTNWRSLLIRVSALLLFLAVVALLALYVALQNLAPVLRATLQEEFSAYGVEQVAISPIELDWGGLQSQSVRLQGQSEAYQFQLELQDLHFQYQWRGLQQLQLQKLAVGSGELLLQLTDNASPPPSQDSAPIQLLAAMLPQQWLQAVPLKHLQLEQLQLTVKGDNLPELHTSARLHKRDDQLWVHLLEATGQELILESTPEQPLQLALSLVGEERAQAAKLDASLAAVNDADDDLEWLISGLVDYTALRQLLELKLPSTLREQLQSVPPLAGSTEFELTLKHAPRLNTDISTLPTQINLNGTSRTALQLSEAYEALPPFALDIHHSLEWRDALLTLTLLDTADLNTTMAASEQTRNQPLPAQLHLPADTQVLADAEGLEQLTLSNGFFSVGDYQLGAQVNLASVQLQRGWILEASTGLSLQWHGQTIPELQSQWQIQGEGDRWQLNLRQQMAAIGAEQVLNGQWNASEQTGELETRIEIGRLTDAIALVRQLAPLPLDVELADGRLQLDANMTGQGADPGVWSKQVKLQAHNLEGLAEGIGFSGLELTGSFKERDHDWYSITPIKLNLAKVHPGVPMSDTQMVLNLKSATRPAMEVKAYSSRLLGGSLFSPKPFYIDLTKESNPFVLQLKDWDLSQLVALHQQPGLEANGILDGELPLDYGSQGLTMNQGQVSARSPGGLIRYQPDTATQALVDTHPELQLATKLLSNLRYQELQCDVNYETDGKLLMGLTLAGNNPNEFDGRDVRFNINLEQNLLDLFKSLRLTDTFTDNLEKKLAQ
jgi:hypothetical protein